jgi:alpha/beta superfamily hydrolase
MPEVIFNGPAGRIEGRYHHNPEHGSPIAPFCIRTRSSAAP